MVTKLTCFLARSKTCAYIGKVVFKKYSLVLCFSLCDLAFWKWPHLCTPLLKDLPLLLIKTFAAIHHLHFRKLQRTPDYCEPHISRAIEECVSASFGKCRDLVTYVRVTLPKVYLGYVFVGVVCVLLANSLAHFCTEHRSSNTSVNVGDVLKKNYTAHNET